LGEGGVGLEGKKGIMSIILVENGEEVRV
jgi:hypothetical protein